jgi:hypothetical protein
MGRVIWVGLQGLDDYPLHFDLGLLSLSVLILGIAFVNGALGWHLILGALGHSSRWYSDMANWLMSQVAKYLPAGTIWYFGGRFLQGKRDGLDNATASLALALEFCFYLVEALAFFGLSMPSPAVIDWRWLVALAALALNGLWCILVPSLVNLAINRLTRYGARLDGFLQALRRVKTSSLRWLPLFYLLQWALIGTGFWLLVASIYQTAPIDGLAMAGIFGLSSAFGYLVVFFIPGGLGVREQALAFLLADHLPFSLGSLVSILARIWYTAIEAVFALLGFLMHRAMTRPSTSGHISENSKMEPL